MIDGQKVMERTNSPVSDEGQPKMAILEQTCMGIFLIHPVPDSIFPTRFLLNRLSTTWKTAADHRW
jgi:hypothetical protein